MGKIIKYGELEEKTVGDNTVYSQQVHYQGRTYTVSLQYGTKKPAHSEVEMFIKSKILGLLYSAQQFKVGEKSDALELHRSGKVVKLAGDQKKEYAPEDILAKKSGKWLTVDNIIRKIQGVEFRPIERTPSEVLSHIQEKHREIDKLYMTRDRALLSQYYGVLNETENESPQNLLDKLKSTEQFFQLNINKELKKHFDELEKNFAALSKLYNEGKVDKTVIHQANLNALMVGATNNSRYVIRSDVKLFQAVVLKKLETMLKPEKKKNKHKEPTLEDMGKIKNELDKRLQQKTENLDLHQAKRKNKMRRDLAWGQSHLNVALAQPSNWVTIRKAVIKESKEGMMHTCVTVIDPINVEDGGVPAGLREHRDYKKRPANFLQTTTYILSSEDPPQKLFKQVSYRGGQFPTKEAAKEALLYMLNQPGGVENLHINALLTPTALTALKKDRKLLRDHKKNIEEALKEIIVEKPEFTTLSDKWAISNFGVNEGAVGQVWPKALKRAVRIPLYLGWHESIKKYSNPAVAKTTELTRQKFDDLTENINNLNDTHVELLANLGAIVQVGQEMEAIWAVNDFANANSGNNQFKMPAYWKAFDTLMGITSYTDCMSGKDRTGQVESHAQAILDEIYMNRIDHEKKIEKIIAGYKLSDTEIKLLKSPLFSEEEVQSILDGKESFQEKLLEKIGAAYESLGFLLPYEIQNKARTESELGQQPLREPFLRTKRVKGRLATRGIAKRKPLIEYDLTRKASEKFMKMAPLSMYTKVPDEEKEFKKFNQFLDERNRHAANIGLSLVSGSLDITEMNTSKPGFKVEGGIPLERLSCGFYPPAVIRALKRAKPNEASGVLFREARLSSRP